MTVGPTTGLASERSSDLLGTYIAEENMGRLDDATGPHLLEGEFVCPLCGNDILER